MRSRFPGDAWWKSPASIAVAAAVLVPCVQSTPWTTAAARNGIALAYRDNPTHDAREVRATVEVVAPTERVFAIVCDFREYHTLVDGVEEARVLSGTIPSDYEFYFRYAAQYLIVDARDVVVRVQSRSDANGSRSCQWSEVAGRMPEQRGVVRMPLLRGSWTIEPLGAGRSRVVYQVAARPGGMIPGWLVRSGALSAIPDVVERLRERLIRFLPGFRISE